MENTQRGFVMPLLLVLIAVLVVGGGVYVYENKKTEAPIVINNAEQNPQNSLPSSTSNPAPVTFSSASCGDFAALSDFVLRNIQQADSQNVMEANKYLITSIRWKRSSGEPFVSYPVINGIRAFYGAPQPDRTHDFIVTAIKNDSDSIGQKIDAEVKSLGLVADTLNTTPFQGYTNQDVYLRTLGFRGGDNLYSVVLKVEGGSHQAPPEGIVTVACGRAVSQYDSVYNALNFKADATVQDTYDNDYVEIGDVSSDKTVYALLGSPNHIKVADYYYFNGATAKLVSKDSYPAQCKTLESQRVGQGMKCADQNYNQRTVTYTSASNSPSQVENPTISVSGMSKYTDADFGFSFWYPTSWTVQSTTIKNSYTGGTIQKTLTVAPPFDPNGMSGGAATVDEVYSPTREITIPKDLCSPMSGSFVAEHRYYFDVSTHTWMAETPAYTGYSGRDGSPYSVPASTKVADVSSNTMGGLHMLGAGCSGAVIPLSAKNFIVFLPYSRSVGSNYVELAKTTTATDPSVATPVSSEEQKQVITKAGVLLGAIGTTVGQWIVTSERVYNWRGDVVAGANPSIFRLINTYSDGTTGASYATDGMRVYSAWFAEAPVLSGADPATFVAIRQQYQIPYAQSSGLYGQSFTDYDTQFAKDKSHVWYQGKLIPNADPITFAVTGNTLTENASGGYTLAHDSNHSYGIDTKNKLTVDGIAIQ